MLDTYRLYRFPANSRAEALTIGLQLFYLRLEIDEAINAFYGGEKDERTIEELWDVIHTAEGALRKFKPQQVHDGYLLTVAKCNGRGNYSVEALKSEDWGLS